MTRHGTTPTDKVGSPAGSPILLVAFLAVIAALVAASYLWAASTAQAWSLGFMCALAVVGLLKWAKDEGVLG